MQIETTPQAAGSTAGLSFDVKYLCGSGLEAITCAAESQKIFVEMAALARQSEPIRPHLRDVYQQMLSAALIHSSIDEFALI